MNARADRCLAIGVFLGCFGLVACRGINPKLVLEEQPRVSVVHTNQTYSKATFKALPNGMAGATIADLLLLQLVRKDDAFALGSLIVGTNEVVTATIPIAFETGAGWPLVKPTYHILPAYARLICQGQVKITVSSSGETTFSAFRVQ